MKRVFEGGAAAVVNNCAVGYGEGGYTVGECSGRVLAIQEMISTAYLHAAVLVGAEDADNVNGTGGTGGALPFVLNTNCEGATKVSRDSALHYWGGQGLQRIGGSRSVPLLSSILAVAVEGHRFQRLLFVRPSDRRTPDR